jgi:hypothetical protein
MVDATPSLPLPNGELFLPSSSSRKQDEEAAKYTSTQSFLSRYLWARYRGFIPDFVSEVIASWSQVRPKLDTSSVAVVARILRPLSYGTGPLERDSAEQHLHLAACWGRGRTRDDANDSEMTDDDERPQAAVAGEFAAESSAKRRCST